MSLSVKCFLRLFDSLVSPILLYACEVTNVLNITQRITNDDWSFFDNVLSMQQELLHIRLCKYLIGVGKKTSNLAALSECGRYPIFLKAMKQI